MSIKSGMKRFLYRVVARVVAFRDSKNKTSKNFPTCQGQNFLYVPMLPDGNGRAYYTKYHAEQPINPLAVDFKRFKTDILEGRLAPRGHLHTVRVETPSALPVAVTGVEISEPDSNYRIDIKVGDQLYRLGNLAAERFHYLPVRDPGAVEIRSDHDVVVGDAIAFGQARSHQTKLVLVLFIDTFGWDIVDRLDLVRDLPNISRLMKDGLTFDNCYSSSNWTLPGVGTIVSGRSLSRHGMFHPTKNDIGLGDGYRTLPQFFRDDGYLTFQVCGNSRRSPAYGYVRGYDRTIYKDEISIAEMTDAFFDHLRAFPNRDHFVWLTFMDAHHTLTKVPDVANQLALPLMAHDYTVEDAKSPLRVQADEVQTLRHIEELKRIDFHLGRILAFVEQRYSADEFLVSIVADHGTGFISADPHIMSHEKGHVAYIVKGPGVPAGVRSREIVQNTDILPTLLHLSKIPLMDNIDGRLPAIFGGAQARDHAVCEILYLGRPYIAAVKDEAFEFYLTSEGPVDDDGRFFLGNFRTQLYRRKDWSRDVSAEHPEVVARYVERVKSHIEDRTTAMKP